MIGNRKEVWSLRLPQNVINTFGDIPDVRKRVEVFCRQLAAEHVNKMAKEDETLMELEINKTTLESEENQRNGGNL